MQGTTKQCEMKGEKRRNQIPEVNTLITQNMKVVIQPRYPRRERHWEATATVTVKETNALHPPPSRP